MSSSADGRADTGRAKVFLSYSRADLPEAQRLRDQLIDRGFDAYLDVHDILPGEPWEERLAKLIETADTVVFLVSPDSVASKVCDWEVNEAERLSKRILPTVIRETPGEDVPRRLRRLNYIFLRSNDDRGEGLSDLSSAILTDIGWIREHTRIGELAGRWQLNLRSDALLRGDDLTAAEHWASTKPAGAPDITPLQADYIAASKALHIRQQQIRARWRNGLSMAGAVTLIVISALSWFFFREWQNSEARQSLFLADLSRQQLDKGDADASMLLALEGLPDPDSRSLTKRLRPYLPAAEARLFSAAHESRSLFPSRDLPLTSTISHQGTFILSDLGRSRFSVTDVVTGRTITEFVALFGSAWPVLRGDDSLVFIDLNRNIVVLDGRSGKVVTSYPSTIDPASVARIILSQSGKVAAVTVLDGTVHVVEIESGKLLGTIPTIGESLRAVSNDGTFALASFSDWGDNPTRYDGFVVTYDVRTGKQKFVLRAEHQGSINLVALSADDSRLAVATTGTAVCCDFQRWIHLWDPRSGSLVSRLEGHQMSMNALSFNPDGTQLLSASNDGSLRLWDGRTGSPIGEPLVGVRETSAMRNAVFDSTGNGIVASGGGIFFVTQGKNADGERTIYVTRAALIEDPKQLRFIGETGQVATLTEAVYFQDILNTDVGNTQLAFWDARPGTVVETQEEHSLEQQQRYDGARISSADGEKHFQNDPRPGVWSIGSDVPVPIDENRRVVPEHDIKLNLGDTGFSVQSMKSGEIKFSIAPEDFVVQGASLGPDGKTIFLVGVNLTQDSKPLARTLSTSDWKLITEATLDARADCIMPSARGDLAAVCVGKQIAIFDTLSGAQKASLSTPSGGHAQSAKFSPDGGILFGADYDTGYLWSLSDHSLVATLSGHSGSLTGAAFRHDGSKVATGSSDGTVRVWDAHTGGQVVSLGGLTAAPMNLSFQDSGRVISATVDEKRYSWRITLDTAELLKLSKQNVPRCLTPEERSRFFLETQSPTWCVELGKKPYDIGSSLKSKLLEARNLIDKGQNNDASRLLAGDFATNPHAKAIVRKFWADDSVRKGMEFTRKERVADGVKAFEEAQKIDSDATDLIQKSGSNMIFNRAIQLIHNGEVARALDSLSKVRTFEIPFPVWKQDGLLEAAAALIKKGKRGDAQTVLDSIGSDDISRLRANELTVRTLVEMAVELRNEDKQADAWKLNVEAVDTAQSASPKDDLLLAYAISARGDANASAKRSVDAISDYTESLRLHPINAGVLVARARMLRNGNASNEAIADFSKAIDIDPLFESAYKGRGQAYFDQGDFARAHADFDAALKIKENPYSWLNSFVAQARVGQTNTQALGSKVSRLYDGEWPRPVMEMLLDRRSTSEVIAVASDPGQKCEAQFYAGQWHVLRGEQSQAKIAFKEAVSICPPNFIEYASAQAELARP